MNQNEMRVKALTQNPSASSEVLEEILKGWRPLPNPTASREVLVEILKATR